MGQPDYDALAQQHGGTAAVDYDALAAQHGGSVAQGATHKETVLGALGSDLAGFVPKSLKDAAKGVGQNLLDVSSMGLLPTARVLQNAYQRVKSGQSLPYAAGAAEAQGLGANVPAMESAAERGDVSGVIGHSLSVPVTLLGGEAIGRGAGYAGGAAKRLALLGKTPEAAYESALKPSTTIPEAKRAAIVQTGLQEGIPVSKAGIEKLSNRIDELNSAIDAKIKAGAGQGITVDPHAVASRLADTAQKFSMQVNPEADVNAVANAGNEFLRNNPNPIPADQAQALKQGTYKQLGSKAYGELGSATIEAQKALARGIKEELASQIPEISQLNAADSKLYDLKPVLERAVNRIGNHQIMGIGTPIVTGAVKAVSKSSSLAAVAGVMKAVLDNPAVKSRLAIAISKGGNIPVAAASQKVAAYRMALANAENEQVQSQP